MTVRSETAGPAGDRHDPAGTRRRPRALRMGLANRLTEPGGALDGAVTLAHELARLPQTCMREDRASAYEQWDCHSMPRCATSTSTVSSCSGNLTSATASRGS